MRKQFSKSFYWAITFIVFTPLVISLVLSWVCHSRIHDFNSHQEHIAHSSVERLSEDIGNIIDENHRLVKLFADNEITLIAQLAADPDNDKLREKMQQKIKQFFPYSFSYTIADSHGNPLLDDLDEDIGYDVSDMRKMIADKHYAVRIHPNPYVYHYDTMATWQYQGKHGFFFVSFSPRTIAHLLRAASPTGHQLLLVIKDQNYLIEITAKGARNATIRNDYHLTSSERTRILDMVPVRNSLWHLADLADPGLLQHFRLRTYRAYGMVVLAFILIAVTFSIILLHVEKKRRHAESMRDEMLSLFSHDLRSPLTGIKGAMDLLKERSTDIENEQKENLYHLIHDQVIHMGRIVDDILDVHKFESGKMTFQFERIKLRWVIEQAVAMVAGYAVQFNVHLQTEYEAQQDIYINADKERLVRVITNLITNALKFSPAGETVVIRTSQAGNMASIAIEDHGSGIPASLQPFIFQKFVQSRQRQVHNLPSTGLGLTIVKYITEAHGGKVSFETSPDKGTTFFLELPISASEAGDTVTA